MGEERYSICTKCYKKCKATLFEKDNKVYLQKHCHETDPVLISSDAKTYFELDKLHSDNKKPKEYVLYLTKKCNLNCPICFANANSEEYKEPDLEFIRKSLKGIKGKQITLFGGEPTIREDLVEVIQLIKKTGNHPVLYTNGIKTADSEYMTELKNAGLAAVMLSFEGFKEAINIRGKDITKERKETLDNLTKLEIPVHLSVILSEENIGSVKEIINYAATNQIVRSVLFSSSTPQGKFSGQPIDREKLIQLLDNETNSLINANDVVLFNKLLYVARKYVDISICPNKPVIPILRNKTNLTKYLEIEKIGDKIDRYIAEGTTKSALSVTLSMLNFKTIVLLKEIVAILTDKPTKLALGGSCFIVSIGNICNPLTADFSHIDKCRLGEISTENNKLRSFCMSNIANEIKRNR